MKLSVLAGIVTVFYFMAFAISSYGQNSRIVFYDATVLDPETGKRLTHQEVIVVGSKIVAVQPISSLKSHTNSRIIQSKGKYIIPGFWDMHAHILIDQAYQWQFPLFLANGVIGIREMWGRDMRKVDSLRIRMRSGELPYFHLTASGHIIDGKKVYWPGQLSAPDTATAIRIVDSLSGEKIDFIKVYSYLEPVVFEAIARRATQRGIPFAGHVPHRVWVTKASDAGMATMEHLYGFLIEACEYPDSAMKMKKAIAASFEASLPAKQRKEDSRVADQFMLSHFSEDRMRMIARVLRRNNTYVVPTMVMNKGYYFANDSGFTNDPRRKYLSLTSKDFWKETIETDQKNNSTTDWVIYRSRYTIEKAMIRILAEEKVPIMTGTDSDMPYAFPGFGVHDEMALLVESGMTPLDALRTATINPVRYLKMTDSLGNVSAGKRADFVVLNGDPMADISNTQRIFTVVTHGKVYTYEELEKMKADVIRMNASRKQ